MTTSVSLLTGLNQVINEKISFLCYIYHNRKYYYLGLGKHSLIFLREDIKNIQAEVYYAAFEKILLDMYNKDII